MEEDPEAMSSALMQAADFDADSDDGRGSSEATASGKSATRHKRHATSLPERIVVPQCRVTPIGESTAPPSLAGSSQDVAPELIATILLSLVVVVLLLAFPWYSKWRARRPALKPFDFTSLLSEYRFCTTPPPELKRYCPPFPRHSAARMKLLVYLCVRVSESASLI